MTARSVWLVLDRDTARRMLPAVIASIVLLAGLAVAALATSDEAIARWQSGLRAHLTVEIVAPPAGTEATVAAVLEVLGSSPGVMSAREIGAPEVRALLEPWLGEASQIATLPLPRLIDVELDPAGSAESEGLAALLQARVPSARLDDHGRWLGTLSRLGHAARVMAAVALAVTAIAAILVIVLTTHAGLAARRETIEILRLLGTPDALVARLFQQQIVVLSVAGTAGGFVAAAAALLVLQYFPAPVAAEYGLRAVPPLATWAALLAVPLLAALAATLACRVTGQRLLARMP